MADIAQDILDDSGYRSRKYVALYVYWALVTLALAGSIRWPSVKDLFGAYWAALSTGLAAYYGVNWGHSFLASGSIDGKTVTQRQESDSFGSAKVPEEDDPPPRK
jgi:hypothetical protein